MKKPWNQVRAVATVEVVQLSEVDNLITRLDAVVDRLEGVYDKLAPILDAAVENSQEEQVERRTDPAG